MGTIKTSNIVFHMTLCAILFGSIMCEYAHSSVIGGPIMNPSNDHTYYLLSGNTWTGSQAEALGLGGNLVTIRNAAENQWIFSTFGNYGGSNRGLWTGYTDQDEINVWKWVSGEPTTYTNWEPGEPGLPGQENWAMMSAPYWGRNGGWNNFWNTSVDGASLPICGVVEIVPEPATLLLLGLGSLAMTRKRKA